MFDFASKKIEHWKIITLILVVYDFVAIAVSYFMALWVRFDCQFNEIPSEYLKTYSQSILPYAVFCILVFSVLRLYKSIWRFASYRELYGVAMATLLTAIPYYIVIWILPENMPVSYFIFGIFLQFMSVLGIRFSYRFVLLLRGKRRKQRELKNVMIIGAGQAGEMILRDVRMAKETNEKVCCFIDDNSNKWGRYIDEIPVVGGRDDILKACEKYEIEKIYLAIPSASAAQKRDIITVCNETGCELLSLPGIYQLTSGEVTVSQMKEVQIEDLLGRDPIQVNTEEILNYLKGKTVMVTGGGGSIGSELCRQIAAHEPKQLIIFDIYENNAYEIQQELKTRYPSMNLKVLIGSVRDSRLIFKVFEMYRPQIVYHAAAHKHVPLMEDSPCEAIKNNAFGTYKTAYAAMVNGCERFVLISTDKAVNPTNIMGASKRLCEKIIQAFDNKIKEGKADEIPQIFSHKINEMITETDVSQALKSAKTEFVAVRFGNVLGSNGSVVPLFKKQIAAGGPVTVTHPDIIRYFMTIPEAVGLVLLAGTYAKGGEIFVLDMGEPVKIDSLARNLIRLSGYKPDVDIQIRYTGLRPGEKLYEEKLMAEEGMRKTQNELIHIGNPLIFETNQFFSQLKELMEIAYTNDIHIRENMQEIVETYHPS